ncbi:putative purine permease 11 [Dichanthelium oligosanthes]|uniref:Probable purine permease n=1 Tax=Dichanthelium oligosanthes TaxID=888268 RepID=A0A1E5UKB5_9POAL|nr:putative purine permease 11 [Dichanthelium oligosanthes]
MVLGGQAGTFLLGRLYFNSGGGSAWMFTLAHSVGSPLLAAPLLLTPRVASADGEPNPSAPKTAAVCVALGVVIAFDNLMYAYAVLYLPVSTFSLLAATQLAFNAVTSLLINAQCFTALILNSVVVLTFSAALLGVGSSSDETASYVPRGKYAGGFVLTLSAAAVYALILSLFELTFDKVIRTRTLRNGRARYTATLLGIAVAWQAASLGMVRLITRASSLFANVTSTLGLPLVPIFAVPLFGDKMTGIKVLAMLMAVWGFLSYVYQHYLDDRRAAAEKKERTPADCSLCERADGKTGGCACTLPTRDSACTRRVELLSFHG